jgi:hypothetical protein
LDQTVTVLICVRKVPGYNVGRDSSVGIATRYGLGGPRIESRWGRNFPNSSKQALGPIQPPVIWVPGLPRGKAVGVWRWPPTPSSAEVKERVELHIYSPSGASWSLVRWTWPLPLSFSSYNVLWKWKYRLQFFVDSFPASFQLILECYLKLGHDCFLLYTFQSINDQRSTICDLNYW